MGNNIITHSDTAIIKDDEDKLERGRFVEHLYKSLENWKSKDCLTVSINGEWGSGKTSIINLLKEKIANEITIIDFNPWLYSNKNNLTEEFFGSLIKKLKIKDKKRYKELSEKLKLYIKLFEIFPSKKEIINIGSIILIIIGLFGIFIPHIILLKFIIKYKSHIWITSSLFIVAGFINNLILKFSNYFGQQAKVKTKPLDEIKNEISKEIKEKLIIIIDDIDRLNKKEIEEIFRLIRINADFSNIIYILLYDKNIIAKSLDNLQEGVNGQEYLKKIIQVEFDIPFINKDIILKIFIEELIQVIYDLPNPEKIIEPFNSNEFYWNNIRESCVTLFIKNIRDIKRFINSFKFNTLLLFTKKEIEVNLIDAIAIEAIRVFLPEYYNKIKQNKSLFLDSQPQNFVEYVTRSSDKEKYKKERVEKINETLTLIGDEYRDNLKELICQLFPQLGKLYEKAKDTNPQNWNRNLRVCSEKYFDRYFAFSLEPEEINEYELKRILRSTKNQKLFQKHLENYLKKNKLKQVLIGIQNYIYDQEYFHKDIIKQVFIVFSNLSDKIPYENFNYFSMPTLSYLIDISQRLLTQVTNLEIGCYSLLSEIIYESKGIYLSLEIISLELKSREENPNYRRLNISEENLQELKELCILKIKSDINFLMEHPYYTKIVDFYKNYGDLCTYNNYINKLLNSHDDLLPFLTKFLHPQEKHITYYYSINEETYFYIYDLNNYIDVEIIKIIVDKIISNPEIYQKNKNLIDRFNDAYEFIKKNPNHLKVK